MSNRLETYVYEWLMEKAIEYDGNVIGVLQDLLEHGCASGIVSELIYYTDTHKFYDKYYEEIEDIRVEYEESTGEALSVGNDLKNFYAWFSFKETARKIADKMELGI